MADRIGTSGSGSGGALLPEDAIQYLQLIDAADKVNNAPNFIDSNAWQILCKMRRSKIENEFRVIDSKINLVIVEGAVSTGIIANGFQFQLRCCGAQIAESETSQIAVGKRIGSKKSKLIQCDGKIDALKEQKVQFMRFHDCIPFNSLIGCVRGCGRFYCAGNEFN